MYTHKAYPIYLEESKGNSHTKACEGPLLPKKRPPNLAAAYYVYALRTTDTDAHIPLVDEKLTKYQTGFIPGRSCVGQLPNLTRQHRRRLRKIDDNRAAFVDMSAAYHTVQHRLIIRKLVDMTGDIDLCQVIRGLLNNRRFFVQTRRARADGGATEKNGLPQGIVLAPLLFNVYTNDQPLPTNCSRSIYVYVLMTSVSPHNKVIFNMLNIH